MPSVRIVSVVHVVHGECDGFTSARRRRCLASLRRALPPHTCHGARANVAGTWRWALFTVAPSVARRRRNHKGRRDQPCVPHLAACASISTTVAHAPARPVVSGTPALRAASQATRAMLGVPGRAVPGLPTPVPVHRLKHYLSNYDAALRDSVVGGFTHDFRIPSTIQHPTAHTYVL